MELSSPQPFELPLTNGHFLVDNSFLDSLITCPRKMQYRSLNQRSPMIEKPALNFGQAMHQALEYRYSVCQNRPVTNEDEQLVLDKILTPFFEENPPPEGDHRTLDWCIEVFRAYNQRYVTEPWRLLKWTNPKPCPHCLDKINPSDCFWCRGTGLQEVITEMTFLLPLYTRQFQGRPLNVDYVGRIDLPVFWDDMLIIGDHKTASTLGPSYFDGQKVSPQFEGYAWAFAQILAKFGQDAGQDAGQVAGFCINAIRTKEKPAKPRSGWTAWWEEGFIRHKEYLKPGQLDEWKDNTINHIEEFFYHFDKGYFPMRKKACTLYGKCPYYDVCYLPDMSRLPVLNSNLFSKETWSPLKQPQPTEV